MGSTRNAGPIGVSSMAKAVDDGTICRAASPTPGITGRAAAYRPSPLPAALLDGADWEVLVFDKETFTASMGPWLQAAREKAIDKGTLLSNGWGLKDDVPNLLKLNREFGLHGKWRLSKKGRVVFEGRKGAGKLLPRNMYGRQHPKLVQFKFAELTGKGLLKSTAKSGFVSFVIAGGVDVYDFLTTYTGDESGPLAAELAVKLGTTAVKSAVGTGLALATAALLTKAAAGVAVGVFAPVAAAIVIGIAVGYTLDVIDTRYKITERLQAWARERELALLRAGAEGYGVVERGFIQWMRSYGLSIPYYR